MSKKTISVSSKRSPTAAWQVALTTGWTAAKQNRIPALVMWAFGVALIASYFYVQPFHEFLGWVGRIKTAFGWKFSLVSTAIFGGLIPTTISIWLRQHDAKGALGFILSSTLLWAYKGVEIDFFYRFQAWLFGSTPDLMTIAIKTICDQFIMVPSFGLVNVVLFYMWREGGYSFENFVSKLGPGWYQKRVLPVLIANWVIWIPAVAMIYCLPVALQLPVQNLILCFWVLILLFFTNDKPQTT